MGISPTVFALTKLVNCDMLFALSLYTYYYHELYDPANVQTTGSQKKMLQTTVEHFSFR
jgi:hypothetical protein